VPIASDAGLAAHLAAGDDRPVILRGGDLHRTTGASAAAETSLLLPIDVVAVDTDDGTWRAVAHVVARRPGRLGWWRGPIVAAMNAEHLGRLDVAPRAHPNDGRVDVVTVDAAMGVRDRWQAWRRLPTGSHLPHPRIAVARRATFETTFERPLAIFVDGVERARSRDLRVTVEPDAAAVYV